MKYPKTCKNNEMLTTLNVNPHKKYGGNLREKGGKSSKTCTRYIGKKVYIRGPRPQVDLARFTDFVS
jgi:hypothetical protein